MTHPLFNSDSEHYSGRDIQDLEYNLSVIKMLGWIEGNLFKYNRRLGKRSYLKKFVSYEHKKTHLEEIRQKDLKKIKTFKEYEAVITQLIDIGYVETTVGKAFAQENIKYEYWL